jgi:RND family efflux transporter MFP subunit
MKPEENQRMLGRLFGIGIGLTFGLASVSVGAQDAESGGGLETVIAKRQERPAEYVLNGRVEAVNQTTVSAQTQGTVMEISYDINDEVAEGDLLVELDDTEQRAAVSEARAGVAEARSRRLEAKLAFDRIEKMFDRDAASESEFDQAQAALDASDARLQGARAQLERAREQLEYTTIRAPYSGVVTERHIEIGETVRPGTPIMTGIELDAMRVVVGVPQRVIDAVQRHRQARVLFDDGRTVEATALTFYPTATPSSHTVRVRVRLPEGLEGVYPGAFARVVFHTGRATKLMIPAPAIVYRSEVTGVYILDSKDRVHFRYIRRGSSYPGGQVEVLSGLSEGERVALDPIAAGVVLKQQRASLQKEASGNE